MCVDCCHCWWDVCAEAGKSVEAAAGDSRCDAGKTVGVARYGEFVGTEMCMIQSSFATKWLIVCCICFFSF